MNNLLIAFSFLTVIPLHVKMDKKSTLAGAMVFFPFVGMCIALLSLFIASVIGGFVSERFVNLCLVLLPIVLSGGLHIDAVSDFFDGFFQGKGKEDILRVMKDSRIGVWGALSIVFIVLLKWELLNAVTMKNFVYVFALALSRWAHVFICYLCPDANDTKKGLGSDVAKKIDAPLLVGASIIIILLGAFKGLKCLLVFIITAIFIYLLSLFYKRKIGGVTGDVIGATGEFIEVAVYMLIIFYYGTI